MDARYAALTGALGLSTADLAEIGGFSARFARALVAGHRPYPSDVREALALLYADTDVMTDAIIADVEEGAGGIFVFRANAELRAYFPQWPGRGKAAGGFVGPHRIAALAAADILDEKGIEVDILFHD